jgi:hypothetical protein
MTIVSAVMAGLRFCHRLHKKHRRQNPPPPYYLPNQDHSPTLPFAYLRNHVRAAPVRDVTSAPVSPPHLPLRLREVTLAPRRRTPGPQTPRHLEPPQLPPNRRLNDIFSDESDDDDESDSDGTLSNSSFSSYAPSETPSPPLHRSPYLIRHRNNNNAN